MAPSLLLTKMPMTPLRVMGMVVGVAVICLIFSAFRAPSKTLKLGATLDQPPAAAAAALHVKVSRQTYFLVLLHFQYVIYTW